MKTKFWKEANSLAEGAGAPSTPYTGSHASRRRTTAVSRKRLKTFSGRIRRFRILDNAGGNAKKVLRTGGTAGFTYGLVAGVADSTLRQQRLAVMAAARGELHLQPW